MAKAKKSTTPAADAKPVSVAKESAPKTAAKKKTTKTATPAQAETPMIDTNLAASVAAKRLANRDQTATPANPSHGESAAFKHMKENLHKPAGQSVPSFLQSPITDKKFNSGAGNRHQQLGRNQTFGADVNRTGVPRRTGG